MAQGMPESSAHRVLKQGWYCPGYNQRCYPQLDGPGGFEQIPRNLRRNRLPTKRINGALLMRHEHPAGALVELVKIAKTSPSADRILHHPPEAFNGIEVMATVGR
jgi:hypothetical protein